LLGHSFGSVLGIHLAADHPEYFYAYIGVGQVIDYDRSVAITYKWLHAALEKVNDVEGLKRIEADKFPYIDLVVKYGGHHRLSIDLDSLKKSSPYYYDGYLELDNKGKSFSQSNVDKNPKAFSSVKSISKIDVPLYFFEGVNDHVIACAPGLVVEYCQNVKAPQKRIIWFKNSAHYMNVEEPDKFQDELIKILKENN
jgi:pimeloyl-ACP methyl ester carboxylesterase